MGYEVLSDTELRSAILRGEDLALGELARRYSPIAYRVAYRVGLDERDVGEVVWRALAIVVRSLPLLPPSTPLGPWISDVSLRLSDSVLHEPAPVAPRSSPDTDGSTEPSPTDGDFVVDDFEQDNSRLAELLRLKLSRTLSAAEQREAERLISEYGRELHESQLRELAEQRGVSVDQLRQETERDLREATQWWKRVGSNPRWRRELAAQLRPGSAPAEA